MFTNNIFPENFSSSLILNMIHLTVIETEADGWMGQEEGVLLIYLFTAFGQTGKITENIQKRPKQKNIGSKQVTCIGSFVGPE